MIALAMGTVLALSFLSQQTTATAVAQNVTAHAHARAIAESALVMTIEHVRASDAWRSELPHGQWVADAPFQGGTYSVWGVDGYDEDGDGQISGAETDGDLADDPSDPMTITVVAMFRGVTHRVQSIVTPGADASLGNLLFVTPDADALSGKDEQTTELFEGWGWTVTHLSADASQASYDAALADVDVVFVTEDVNSSDVGAKLTSARVGVVTDEGFLFDELGMTSGNASSYSGDAIDVVDNTHFITSPFATGTLTVKSSNPTMMAASGVLGAGVRTLAERPGADSPMLIALDAGGAMQGGGVSAGRRVGLPWGDGNFQVGNLNDAGLTLWERALRWAAAGAGPGTLYDYATRSPGVNIWAYDGQSNAAPPSNHTTPGAALSGGEYGDLEADDSDRHSVSATSNGQRPMMRYVIQIDEAAADVTSLHATWIGRNVNAHHPRTDGVALYIWNHAAGSYEQLDVSPDTESEVTLTGVVNASAADYLGGAGANTVTLLAMARDHRTANKTNRLDTDYLSLRVFAGSAEAGEAGDENEPQLIALYDLLEPDVEPVLVGHWKLDESASGGGMLAAVGDRLRLKGGSVIDSYNGSYGPYGGGNVGSNAIVSTNATGNNRITATGGSQIRGDAYSGAGSNPNTVIAGNVTGVKQAQTTNIAMPDHGLPSGMPPSSGSRTYTSSHTFATDQRFEDLVFDNEATITIDGDIRFWVTKKFIVKNESRIIIPAGASLTVYVNEGVEILDESLAHTDTSSPARLTIIGYSADTYLLVDNEAHLAAVVQLEGAETIIKNESHFYGAIISGGDIEMDDGRMHLDTSLSGFGSGGGGGYTGPAYDETAANDGSYQGAQPGVAGVVGTAADFDGSGSYVEIPHHDAYRIDTGSLSFHFKPRGLSGHRAIFSKDSNGYDDGGHLHVYTEGSTLKVRLQSATDSYTVSKAAIAADAWHHVVFQWGIGGMKLYVNGALADANPWTGGVTSNVEPLALGAGTWNSGDGTVHSLNYFFDGAIDEVRLYDGLLDEGQIALLADGEEPGPRTAPAYLVEDTSGHGSPLDLFIEDVGDVQWEPGGGLTFNDATVARQFQTNAKLHEALTATDAMSVEVIFSPATISTVGVEPKRLVAYGQNDANTNFSVGQDDADYGLRLRTDSTGSGGTPNLEAGATLAADTPQHVIISYDGSSVLFYRNGALEATRLRSGDLDGWNSAYPFLLGNDADLSRGFLGTLRRVAIYDRAFDAGQAGNVFNGQPPGPPGQTGGAFSTRWVEP